MQYSKIAKLILKCCFLVFILAYQSNFAYKSYPYFQKKTNVKNAQKKRA